MNERPAGEPSPEIARAEEMVDVAGQVIGGFATRVWTQVAKNLALAREEAEDIVSEARSMSRDQQE